MQKLTFVLVIIMAMVLLVSCSQPSADSSADPTMSPLPTAPVSPISPLPVPQLESDAAEAQELAELAVRVAEQANLPATALTLVSAEQVAWPDMSLGCPQPDMAYAQVLTPGWRMVFVDAEGREYDVHTTENREQFVICEQSDEIAIPPTYRDHPVVQAAITKLAEQEGVSVESVTVVEVVAVEWPNSCLGCEVQGQYCLMVVTPGYRITLQSGTELYALHADRAGKQIIICTQSGPTPPKSDS